jgi:predicted DNA repair protein MutK
MATMSSSSLFLANAAMTITFGVVGLAAPAVTFGQFGLSNISEATQVLIRGYGAAALGYGILVLQLRSVPQAERAVLWASAIFNVAEVALQGHAIQSQAGFNNMVWTTFLGHTVLGIWSVVRLLPTGKKSAVGAKND